MKYNQLESTTFGNSPASLKLVELINEIPNLKEREKTSRKVSRFISDNNKAFFELSLLTNQKTKIRLYGLLRDELLRSKITVPLKIKTFAINVLISKLRFLLLKDEV
jgi:hypothetical protein